MYMTKFQYGFPFLTKLEVEESPEEPPMVLAEEFKQFPIYGLVLTEEGAGQTHLSYLLYVRCLLKCNSNFFFFFTVCEKCLAYLYKPALK